VTHAYLGLAAFDAVVTAVGYALLHGLGLVRTRAAALRHLGLAFLAGWATVGLVLAVGVSVGVDPALRNVLLLALAVAALAVGARLFFPALERPLLPAERRPLQRAAALAGMVLVAIGLGATILYAVRADADGSWDLAAFWLPKAEAIYYFHGLDTGLGGYLTYTHNEYPPLMPATTAATFHFMGAVHQSVLPLQQALLGIAFVGSLVAFLGPRVPRWILFPLLAMLVLAPDFWYRMIVVLPDQTLAYLLAAATVACVLWLDELRFAWLVLATIFLAAATLTKAEGFFLGCLLIAVVAGAAVLLHGRRAYPVLVLAVAPALLRPWHAWLADHHQSTAVPEYDWHDLLRPGLLADRADRLWYAVHKLLGLMFAWDYWSLAMPIALVVLVAVAATLRALTAAVSVWLVLGFAGLAAVYWIGTPPVQWYVSTSAHRVVDTLPIVVLSVLPLLLGLALDRRGAIERAV